MPFTGRNVCANDAARAHRRGRKSKHRRRRVHESSYEKRRELLWSGRGVRTICDRLLPSLMRPRRKQNTALPLYDVGPAMRNVERARTRQFRASITCARESAQGKEIKKRGRKRKGTEKSKIQEKNSTVCETRGSLKRWLGALQCAGTVCSSCSKTEVATVKAEEREEGVKLTVR